MRIGVFFGEGFEEVEAFTTVDLLRRAGYDVETVSVSHTHHVMGSHGIEFKADFYITEISVNSFDMIVLPGGPGHKNLEKCEHLMKRVRKFNDEGKFLAAICAAPTILGRQGVLKGKKATCFPGMEGDLIGATYCKDEEAVWDGNIITGRSAGAAVAFALRIVEATSGVDKAKKLADSIFYDYYKPQQ